MNTTLKQLNSISSYLLERSSIKEAPIPAFHGSPRNFSKFTCYFMFKGEGYHSFGWGLYFTTNKDVAADYYAKRLANNFGKYPEWTTASGKRILLAWLNMSQLTISIGTYAEAQMIKIDVYNDDTYRRMADLVAKWHENRTDNRLAKQLLKIIVRLNFPSFESSIPKINNDKAKLIKYIDNINILRAPTPTLYEVMLWPNKDPNLLNWIQPLTDKQRIKVASQMSKTSRTQKINWDGFWIENPSDINGENFYNNLGHFLSRKVESMRAKWASKFLLDAGIDGIIYPADFFRGATGEQGWNYVVFDDKEVKIIKKEQI